MCPDHDAEECCDFLLATRIRYESRSRVVPAASEAEEPPPAEPDVRAAEFLLATRSQREATERAAADAARRR